MAKKHRGMMTGEPVTYQIPAPAGGVQMETFIPWTLVKRGVRQQVITPIDAPEHFLKEAVVERSARKQAKDSPLIRALGLAHYWQRLLDEERAARENPFGYIEHPVLRPWMQTLVEKYFLQLRGKTELPPIRKE